MTQVVGGTNTSADGKTFGVVVPALSDNASITDAFKYYHQGQTSGSPLGTSIEQYLIDINSRAKYIENAIGYVTYNPVNSGTTNPTYSLNTRVTALETSVGSNLNSTFIKTQPSSNAVPNAATNWIEPQADDIIALTVLGRATQTSSLQEWKRGTNVVARVSSTGILSSYNGSILEEVVTLTRSQTLTNKTLTSPIQTVGTNARTASYTLALTDQSKIIEVASASATTVTVPDETIAFPVGTYIVIIQTSTGQVTVAGAAGVTVNGTPGLKLRTQWSMATLIKRATNTWVIAGDLSA